MRVVNSEYDNNGNPCECTIEDDGEYFHFVIKEQDVIDEQKTGKWTCYSTTMMECSICGRHVPRHKYNFCPHCGARNTFKKGDFHG